MNPAKYEPGSSPQSPEINFLVPQPLRWETGSRAKPKGDEGGSIPATMMSLDSKLCTMVQTYKGMNSAKYQPCSPPQS